MTGEQLKLDGIERVAMNNEEWLVQARLVMSQLLIDDCELCVDNMRHHWGDMPEPAHPNAWGALFAILAKEGLIKRVGYRKSISPSAHSRVVSVWTKA